MAIDFRSDLVNLQRTADAAWAELEAYRKQVDAVRRAEPVETPDGGTAPRPRTPAEDAEYDRLHAAARAAGEARRAGLLASGLGMGYDVVQGLHKAAADSDA